MAVEELRIRGNQAFGAQKYDQAIGLYTDALEMDESNHTIYSNRSACYASLGKWKQAEADARKVISIKPDWPRGWMRLGSALVGQKKFSEAVAAYEEAVQRDPSDDRLREDLENAKAQCAKGGPGAEELAALVQFFAPQCIERLKASGKCKEWLGQAGVAEALSEIGSNPRVITKYSGAPWFQAVSTALVELWVEENKDVMGGAAKGADRRPQPPKPEPAPKSSGGPAEEAKALGNQAFKEGKFQEALEHYERALEAAPTDLTIAGNKGTVLCKLGRNQEAIDFMREALERGRKGSESYDAIARVYQKIAVAYRGLDDLPKAIEALKASLLEKQDPGVKRELRLLEELHEKRVAKAYEDPVKAEEAKELGNTAFKDGQFPEAIAHYTEAIKRAPRSAALYSNRAAAYTKLGELPMAIADCQKALEIQPDYVKAHTRAGLCHYRMKEYVKAREHYLAAQRLDPNNADAVDGLQCIQREIAGARYTGEVDEVRRRAMADPDIQRILQDPGMRQILEDMQENPASAGKYFADPHVREGLEKLRLAGIIQF